MSSDHSHNPNRTDDKAAASSSPPLVAGSLDGYLAIILRIGDRILTDPVAHRRYAELTRRLRACKLERDWSNITNQDHDTPA